MIWTNGRRLIEASVIWAVSAGVVLANENFTAGLTLGTDYTDNANKSRTERTTERQDRYTLLIGADYDNNLLEAGAAYRARERRFAKDSQPNRGTLEGDLDVLLGKQHHPADIRFTHSRRTILNSPDQVDIISNNDERDILTVAPRVRLRPTQRDNLSLQGSYRRIHYRYDDARNSDRLGGSLVWQHAMSATDELELEATNTDVSFDDFPEFDYTYQSGQASYNVDLRNLTYTLTLGYNRAKRDNGTDFSRPMFGLNVDYDEGLNQVTINVRQYITDSSFGGGNDMAWARFGTDGDTVPRLDQLERFNAEARWDYRGLCERCNLFFDGMYRSDDYRNLAEDTDEISAGTGLEYTLSLKGLVRGTFSHRRRTFDDESERTDYDLQRTRLGYRYRLTNDLNVEIHVLYEDRQSDDGTFTYHETRGGLFLSYTFL